MKGFCLNIKVEIFAYKWLQNKLCCVCSRIVPRMGWVCLVWWLLWEGEICEKRGLLGADRLLAKPFCQYAFSTVSTVKFYIISVPSRILGKAVMLYAAETIPKLKTRTQKTGGSDQSLQQGEGGKKGKGKKKKWGWLTQLPHIELSMKVEVLMSLWYEPWRKKQDLLKLFCGPFLNWNAFNLHISI